MLHSSSRETKEQLRMFRDAGGFDRFFPPDDDPDAHRDLRTRISNLDAFEQSGGVWGGQVKTSLGNALRLLRPLIILDEGHKAYSPNARATLEGFNPCMIVELSATPPKGANVLVEISGRELNAEEMIQLDLHITNKANASWQDTCAGGAHGPGSTPSRGDSRRRRRDADLAPAGTLPAGSRRSRAAGVHDQGRVAVASGALRNRHPVPRALGRNRAVAPVRYRARRRQPGRRVARGIGHAPLGRSEDTEYKRSVFDVCSEHAKKTNWAEFVPAMRNKVMRFEVVNEEEWEHRLNAMLAE